MDEKKKLQKMIIDSLDALYQKDQYLIWNRKYGDDRYVSERALMFRFGTYFDTLAQKYFPFYNVDSEYNRNLDDPKVLPGWKNGCYPDLILHKRGSNFENLLVIEMKTWWNPDQTDDRLKIKQFCSPKGEYRYKYGALIFIGKTLSDARITFCTADKEETLCLDMLKQTMKMQSSSSFEKD